MGKPPEGATDSISGVVVPGPYVESVVAFGFAAEIVGAVLVGVLDAGFYQSAEMVVRQAVVDRTALPRRLQHGAVAEKPELVADGGDRKACVLGDFGDVEAVRFGERVDDSDPGVIGDG